MKSIKSLNIVLFLLPILIFSLGYFTLLSTSPERARNQLIFFIVGFLVYIVISLIDYRLYQPYWKFFFVASLVLLLVTFFLGEARAGSARWINLGVFTLQPSEFAKIALVLALSSIVSSSRAPVSNIKKVAKLVLLSLPMLALVLAQPDLGTAVVLFAILVFMLFYAGLSKWYFISFFTAFGIFSAPLWGFLQDYQQRRILVFLNPALDVLGSGYNVIQALIAVGSGGLLGKGFLRGTQSRLNFLPAHWTDFAFASFAEEWGFIGVFILILLFTALLLILLNVTNKTKESFGSLLCVGVFSVFFVQFIVNVGMNLGVMPVTGIPLPFISYGGSSLLVSFILLGIAQSVIIYSYAESNRFTFR